MESKLKRKIEGLAEGTTDGRKHVLVNAWNRYFNDINISINKQEVRFDNIMSKRRKIYVTYIPICPPRFGEKY